MPTHNNAQLQFSEDTRTLANLMHFYLIAWKIYRPPTIARKLLIKKKEKHYAGTSFLLLFLMYICPMILQLFEGFPSQSPFSTLYYYNYRNVVMDLYDTHKDPLAYKKIY